MLRARASSAMRVDVSSILGTIVVPVLYLRASHDRLLSPAAGRHILSAISQCTTVDIIGPHLLLQTAPKECARAVADFAERPRLDANNSPKPPLPLRQT